MTSAVKSGKKHAKKAPRGGKGEKGRRAIVEIASASVAARPLTYAASGVDIEAGDAAVDQFRHLLQKTYGPRVIGRYGGFAGMFRLDYNEKLFRRSPRIAR